MAKSKEDSGRRIRAFRELPKHALGGLQQDHARGSEASRQFTSTSEEGIDGSGVQLTGEPRPVKPHMVDNFQGRSGQPDNQNIHRPKGST